VCSQPPNVTLQQCVDSGGPKINFYSPTSQVALAFNPSSPPSSCTTSNSTIHQVFGNGVDLNYPLPNQCGWYRVCAWDPACTNDYATGVTFHICVNSVGQPSCTF
jgi:hypothetical protein